MDARIIDHHRGHWYQFLEVFPTLTAFMGTGGGNVPLVIYKTEDQEQTVMNSSGYGICGTLDAFYYKGKGESQGVEREYLCIAIEGCGSRPSHNGNGYSENGTMYTLNTIERHAVCLKNERKYILRRLTPLECCRLQGFPDWWMDGVKGSDADKYKMWGNGIALPCAADVLGRIAEELNREDGNKC